MKRTVMAAAAVALAGAAALAFAQTQSSFTTKLEPQSDDMSLTAGMRVSPQDRAVLVEASLGALKGALQLRPDQEKLWEPVEAFIRQGLALQEQRIEKLRTHLAETGEGHGAMPEFDPIAKLRRQADNLTQKAQRMREFADVAAPLYASFSDEQKRNARLLMQKIRMQMFGGHGILLRPAGAAMHEMRPKEHG